MALLRLSRRLVDPIRGKAVVATPEEHVRSRMLEHLKSLGFPPYLMQTEVKLTAKPPQKAPRRRLDIVCYRPASHGFSPLLLIECKAVSLTEKTLHQALGYNYFLEAPFICLVNEKELRFYAADALSMTNKIPLYKELVLSLS